MLQRTCCLPPLRFGLHLFVVSLVATTPVQGQSLEPFINNGLTTNLYPEVGLFFTGTGTCTGTLIGCQTVLTAAHCVCPEGSTGATCGVPSTSGKFVFFQHNGGYAISSIAVHPAWNASLGLGNHDLAVLRLSTPVAGLKPAILGNPVASGTAVQLAGFGTTPTTPAGIKRWGQALTSSCGDEVASAICYDFELPLGPPGADSTACPGDSGGPMFASQAGYTRLVGVTSGGQGPGYSNCTAPVQGVFSSVASDTSWITTAAAPALLGQSSCGTLQNAGSSGAPIAGGIGSLSSGSPTALLAVNVPPGTEALFATINAESYWGPNDFDLWVNYGTPPAGTDWDCTSQFLGSLEECLIQDPQPGTWYVLAGRYEGAGPVQLTATSFALAAAGGACVPDATTICIDNQPGDKRFKVQVAYQSVLNGGISGFGNAIPLSSLGITKGGLFWFFGADNPELMVKVVNGCGLNNRFWLYASGVTNLGLTATITDTLGSGAPFVITNPDLQTMASVATIEAFPCP